jgi:hypothetical protein
MTRTVGGVTCQMPRHYSFFGFDLIEDPKYPGEMKPKVVLSFANS